jgi:TM2 domain-containing membrane protein YozV
LEVIVKRYPILAGVLSLFVPGLGQIYAGHSTKGGAILIGAIIIANLNILILPLMSLANPHLPILTPDSRSVWAYFIPRVVHDVASFWGIIFWIWAVVDAVMLTRKKPEPK